MGISVETLAVAKKYTKESIEGITGSLAGKNATIDSITDISGGHRVTFKWTADNGDVRTQTMDVMDGEDGAKGDTGATGPQGVKGDKGDTGEKGAKGDNGTSATIRVGTVTSGVSPSVTNSGSSQEAVFDFVLPKGDKGDKGNKGDDGQDGKSFEIKAAYPTYEALIEAHPTGQAGDAYFVGVGTSPDLYTWLSDDEMWYNNGPIAGIKGDKGDTGDDGFSPVASVSKSGTVTTITVRDKTGQTTATINDGEKGDDGAKGDKGDPGEGVPEGGTTGQVLKKKSNTDFDTEWGEAASPLTFDTDDFDVSEENEVSLDVKQRIFTGTTAEWEALTSAEKAKYTLVNLTDDGETGDEENYSTSEVKTNKKWIDGKPIYRKVFNTTTPSSDGEILVATLSSDVEWVTKIEGTLKRNDLQFCDINWTYNGTSYSSTWIYKANSSAPFSIYQKMESTVRSKPEVIIVEYTKTTD